MEFTLSFLKTFFWASYLVLPLLVSLCVVIIVLGQIVCRLEKWQRYDALYWSFITATTVGYGDIRPLRKVSKMLAVIIAVVGMMFTGLIIAVTLNAASLALEKHADTRIIDRIKSELI